MPLPYANYAEQVVAETEQLRAAIAAADLTTPVPTCPAWNVGQLLRHLGGVHRWMAAAVERRVRAPLAEDEFGFRDLSGFTHEAPDVLDPWLAAGAAELAGALRDAGAGTALWTPVPSTPTTDFYARRATHETLVHRADVALALGVPFAVDAAVAVDAIDEWLEAIALPTMIYARPELGELLGDGRTVHLHATDTEAALDAEWVLDLTGRAIAWRRAHEKSAVAVRGPVSELLLVLYRRRPVQDAPVDVFGDEAQLASVLDTVRFG